MKLGFKKVHPEAKLPSYAHEGDAGMDVYAVEDVFLKIGVPTIVQTGLVAEIPTGYELQVRPRSGLSLKGVNVFNAPGTIDCNYRGPIGIILRAINYNLIIMEGDEVWSKVHDKMHISGFEYVFHIEKGDRIAQLVLAPVTKAEVVEVTEVSDTERGTGGFGSTGI